MGEGNHTPIATFRIVRAAEDAAREANMPHAVGLIASDDSFYSVTTEEARGLYTSRGVLGLEMEASAVFTVAHLRSMEAACLATVSNYIGDESLVSDEILKQGVDNMVKVALETIVKLEAEKPLGA
jgi:purine-nucleoside phosphorylase